MSEVKKNNTHGERQYQHNECHRQISSRLATIEGHVKAVRKMLDEQKGCVEIIKQLMAIESAVKKAGLEMLNNHLNTCLTDAVCGNETVMEQLKEFNALLKMYL